MPQMLIDGAVEYEDGTPATEAQVGFLIIFVARFSGEALTARLECTFYQVISCY